MNRIDGKGIEPFQMLRPNLIMVILSHLVSSAQYHLNQITYLLNHIKVEIIYRSFLFTVSNNHSFSRTRQLYHNLIQLSILFTKIFLLYSHNVIFYSKSLQLWICNSFVSIDPDTLSLAAIQTYLPSNGWVGFEPTLQLFMLLNLTYIMTV